MLNHGVNDIILMPHTLTSSKKVCKILVNGSCHASSLGKPSCVGIWSSYCVLFWDETLTVLQTN